MYFSDISNITESDILDLISNKIMEQKTLEYKSHLPDKNKEDSKLKILQSIISFANTEGGIIIFGIKEDDDGCASEVVRIETSTDDDFLRLHNMIKERILPKINPPDIKELVVKGEKIYLMKIFPSFNKPHYVNSNFVFYGRHNNGKYQLDISEIKKLFLQSKTTEEQFENFKTQRIMKLKSKNLPFKYESDSFFAIHIASLESLNKNIQLTMPKIKIPEIMPITNYYSGGEISNYDGYLKYDRSSSNTIISYVQIFRNGFLEITQLTLNKYTKKQKIIPGIFIESTIKDSISDYLTKLHFYGIPYPYFISISFVNTKGYKIKYAESDYRYIGDEFQEIFEEDILLPTIFVENNYELTEKLNFCFEVFWNSNGYSQNPAAKESPHAR